MSWKIFLFLFTFALHFCSCKKKAKSVTTVIDAKWEVTSLSLEMSEYLWDENPTVFWKYVDAISNLQPPLIEGSNEKEMYDRSLDIAKTLISNQQLSLMKFAISLHIYSPRVEMFSQIAVDRGIICPTAADISGTIVCDSTGLAQAIENSKKYNSLNDTSGTLHIDHKYPGNDSGTLVILYGELGTPEFAVFHNILKQLAKAGEIQYILRHWIKERPQKRLRLSGYGVELQMKSTEYKVQDDTKVEERSSEDSLEEEEEVEGFNFSKLKQLYPDKLSKLDKLRQELLESTSELAPLKVWQFQELSLQAAQRIMSAPKEEALNVMLHISQNFPTQAKSLVKTVVSSGLKNEIKQNQEGFAATLHLQPTDTALFINGMYFDMEIQDIFTILDYIRLELKIMDGLKNIGFSERKVFKSLVGLDLANQGGDYALDIRDSAVLWLNDIENDKQYRRWSSSLMDLLRPTFPGMLRSVRKNLYNLILIGDPTEAAVQPLVKLMQSFLVHNAPLRLGLVFAIKPDRKADIEHAGTAMLKAYNYISELRDPSQAINFITDVYAEVGDKNITVEHIKNILIRSFPGTVASEVLGHDSDYLTGFDLSVDFVSRSGFRKMPQILLNGVPLAEKNLNADDFEEAVLSEIMHQTPTIQKAIYKGDLSDKDDVTDFLMTRPNVMPRLNERVLSTVKNVYVDFTDPSNDILSTMINSHIFYATYKSEESKKISYITNWILCDLSHENGRKLMLNAVWQMESSGSIRISLIVNCETARNCHIINKLALLALRGFPPNVASKKIVTLIEKWPEIEDSNDKKLDETLLGIKASDWSEIDESIEIHKKFVDEILNFKASTRGIISNGRVLGPLDPEEEFTVDDFNLLERFSTSAFVEKIHKSIMSNSEVADYLTSDMLMKTISLLASRPESKSRFEINPVGDQHSVLKMSASDPEQPSFDLVAIVDPVSSGAHKLASVLSVLHQVVNADIRIFMNCVEKNSDMPLKSFYRYVLEPEIQFSESGQQGSGPTARFANMPGAPLLTQNMLVPDNWFVESIASPHDLDNIRLDQVDSNVHSQFELEYLILDGHCFDFNTGSPPRGLQITLGTDSSPDQFDTIVMANLGYFQLKANPGAWKLRLREGRSTELYDIVGASHDGLDLPKNGNEVKILMSSLKAHTVKLKVSKKPDKAGIDLLGDDSGDGHQGIWDSITSTFGGSKEESKDPQDNVINIFSVASGHLYERFLRIMMLSVLKNTKSPVKFWFLKNYLSPTFKDFLPTMSNQYGFQYELVQYKWPRWLHQQTEKQRIIWGYKILFLDVLFPLNIKKIIFVDADQVVRTDLKELVDFDLGGAPYGYTPFCDSRREMDGFRFWKSGYWRNHLQGRKYHISALYVVDLKRFRRVAAGDRLRGQYQALSQDPNSLSNLDQDLPNNMIHQVAIKSLPQEWLWCETWCDDASKERAKTIDLCNNPLTKEAKLTAAHRILPEWTRYDEEIKRLQLKLGETDDHEEEHLSSENKKSDHRHSEL